FGEVFGACNAHRNGKSKLLAHAPPQCFRDVRRSAKQTFTTSDISKCLVDREPLDEGGEVAQNSDCRVPQALIFPKIPADEVQLWTQLARPPCGHSAPNPESLCLVGGGQHDPAADGNRSAAQRGVEELFQRCVKGGEVCGQDRRGWHRAASLPEGTNRRLGGWKRFNCMFTFCSRIHWHASARKARADGPLSRWGERSLSSPR